MRVVTTQSLLNPPHLAEEACEAVARLLSFPSLTLLSLGRRYARLLLETVRDGGTVGNLVFDAQIVAVCWEHGVACLLTEDRDFERFRTLRAERL
ncbi:MAG: PIN domain-containing protein [Bryobacterales bacterium]|nr:PIN domain-containing protein [Bryobacterales bacterium]